LGFLLVVCGLLWIGHDGWKERDYCTISTKCSVTGHRPTELNTSQICHRSQGPEIDVLDVK
jgi:hypothetical protein